METLTFDFPAAEPGRGRTLVGCVSSGDLEVLIEPGTAGHLQIQVVTSVDGSAARWGATVPAPVRGPRLAGREHRHS